MMQSSGGALSCGSVRFTSSVAILCFSSIGRSSGLLMQRIFVPLPPASPAASGLGLFLLGPCRIVDLHAGPVAQRPEDLVAAGNDLVPFFQAVGDLDIQIGRAHV